MRSRVPAGSFQLKRGATKKRMGIACCSLPPPQKKNKKNQNFRKRKKQGGLDWVSLPCRATRLRAPRTCRWCSRLPLASVAGCQTAEAYPRQRSPRSSSRPSFPLGTPSGRDAIDPTAAQLEALLVFSMRRWGVPRGSLSTGRTAELGRVRNDADDQAIRAGVDSRRIYVNKRACVCV